MALIIWVTGGSMTTGSDFLCLCSRERYRKQIVFACTLILVFSFAVKVQEFSCFHLYLNFVIYFYFQGMGSFSVSICTRISLFSFAFWVSEASQFPSVPEFHYFHLFCGYRKFRCLYLYLFHSFSSIKIFSINVFLIKT